MRASFRLAPAPTGPTCFSETLGAVENKVTPRNIGGPGWSTWEMRPVSRSCLLSYFARATALPDSGARHSQMPSSYRLLHCSLNTSRTDSSTPRQRQSLVTWSITLAENNTDTTGPCWWESLSTLTQSPGAVGRAPFQPGCPDGVILPRSSGELATVDLPQSADEPRSYRFRQGSAEFLPKIDRKFGPNIGRRRLFTFHLRFDHD